MKLLIALIITVFLTGCYMPKNDNTDLLWEIEMIRKEWDRLEDPHSKKKASCFSECDDQPISCFYKCSDAEEQKSPFIFPIL